MRNFSYIEFYDWTQKTRQRFRDAIPKDQITPDTRAVWDFEDQRDKMLFHYYQQLEEKRLAKQEKEEPIYEIKFKSEVKVKK